MFAINLNIILTALILIFIVIYHTTTIMYDSTDSKELKKRSNMSLYIDYATGNQYIKCGLFGQAILRLDENGEPLNYYRENNK